MEKVEDFKPSNKRKKITVSGGGTGVQVGEKSKVILDAIKDRNDVDLHVYKGRGQKANDDILKEISKNKNVKIHGFTKPEKFKKALSTSDLNVGYTGTSSLSENMSFKNPSAVYTTLENDKDYSGAVKNLKTVRDQYGLPSFTASQKRDFKRFINKTLDNPEEAVQNKSKVRKKYLKDVDKSKKVFDRKLRKAFKRSKITRPLKAVGLGAAGAGLIYHGTKE